MPGDQMRCEILQLAIEEVVGKPDLVLVEDRTQADHRSQPHLLKRVLQGVKSEFPTLSAETLEAFLDRNREPSPVENCIRLKSTYTLVPREELKRLFDLDGWSAISDKFPGATGVLTLSEIGFDKEMQQALVYVAFQHGGTGGVACYIFLESDGRAWKIVGKKTAWQS